jgi:hypothetical protein
LNHGYLLDLRLVVRLLVSIILILDDSYLLDLGLLVGSSIVRLLTDYGHLFIVIIVVVMILIVWLFDHYDCRLIILLGID